jgi:Ca2+/Na+ antiporter
MCVKLTINQKYNKSRSSWKYYTETTQIGFIVGLAILTRGNIWIFTPGIAIFIISAELHNRQFKKAASALLLFTLFLLLPQLPFIWHNTKINGKLTAPSTAAGAVLSLGNTPESPPGGRDPGSGAGPMEYPETCRYWGGNAKKTPVYLQMLKWFKREPLAFSELLFRKMLLFWDYREIPNNLAIETQGLKSRTLRTIGFLPVQKIDTANSKFEFLSYNLIPGSLLILTLGVAGILSGTIRLLSGGIKKVIKNFYRHLPEYILLYLIISYWLGTALFYILGRFRVPIIPLLAISGSIFICRFYSFYKRFRSAQSNSSGTECKKTASPDRSTALRNTQNSNKTDKKQHYTAYKTIEKKMLTTSFIILLSAFFTVTFGYSLYRYGFESKIISFVRPYGVRSLIGERTLMIKDNGPLSFGSWTPFELHDGDIIDKRFILPEKNNNKESISLKIECYCQVPGKAILNINGKKFTLNEKNRGMNKHTFTIPPLKSNRIRITPVNLDCRLLFFLDRQRNYGRTEINGKNPEAELVSTLYIHSNKKK